MKMYDYIRPKLVDLICDPSRPNLSHPNDYNGNWWVSNGYVCLVIPHTIISEAGVNDIDLKSVLLGCEKLTEPKIFTYESFRNSLSVLNSKEGFDIKYKDCPQCDGEGDIECKCCKNVDTCEECEGEGQIEISRKPNGRLQYSHDLEKQYVKLGAAFFDPNMIALFLQVIEILDLQSYMIELTHNSHNKPSILNVGYCKFLIIGCLKDANVTHKSEIL